MRFRRRRAEPRDRGPSHETIDALNTKALALRRASLKTVVETDRHVRGRSLTEPAYDEVRPGVAWVLAERVTDARLVALLSAPDLDVRRAAARELVGRGVTVAAVDEALRQGDVVTAALVAEAALRESTLDTLTVAERCSGSRFASIAARGAFVVLRSGVSGERRSAFLLDRRRAVRSVAQDEARRLGEDPTAVYRPSLLDESAVAITGLGECGSKADVAAIEALVASGDARVRAAALAALARLDAAASRSVFVRNMTDAAPSVAKAATRGLVAAGLDEPTLRQLEGLITTDEPTHIRSACRYVAMRVSRWHKLRLVFAATSTGPARNELAEELAGGVDFRSVRTFTRPTAADCEVLAGNAARALARLPAGLRDNVAQLLSDYGVAMS